MRALGDLDAATRQMGAVAATLGVGLLGTAVDAAWGRAVAIAAVLVAVVVAVRCCSRATPARV